MENEIPNQPGSSSMGQDIKPPISPNITAKPGELSTGRLESFAPTPEAKPAPSPEAPIPPQQVEVKKAPAKEKKSFKLPNILPSISPKLAKKIALIGGIVIVAGAIVFLGAYFYLTKMRGIPVTILSDQEVVNLTLDGNKTSNIPVPHILNLKVGKHTIIVDKDGFMPQEEIIEIGATDKSKEITFNLTEKAALAKILDKEVFYPTYNKATDSFFYFAKNETGGYLLYEYDVANQKETALTSATISDIERVVWSPHFKEVVVKTINKKQDGSLFPFLEKYGEGAKINWILSLDRADLVNVTVKNLDPAIKNVSFSPQGDKIVYYFQNDIERSLAVANNDGSEFERIVKLQSFEFDANVVWSPDSEEVAIFADKIDETGEKRSDVYLYSFSAKEVRKITDHDVSSFGALFSPDSKNILYSSGGSLWVYNKAEEGDGTSSDLRISADLDKCSWFNNEKVIAYSQEGKLLELNVNGTQRVLDYKESSLPKEIKNILIGSNKIFIVAKDGIYELTI